MPGAGGMADMSGSSGGGSGLGGSGLLGGIADLAFGLAGGWGKKPKVAPYHRQLLPRAQGQAIGANIGAFPQLNQLGQLYTSSLLDSLNKQLPGYSDVLAKGESGTSKLLDVSKGLLGGELPQDVIDQIQRSSAYQSLSGGYAGSGMSHALTARDLGLTSLDLMRQGAQMLGQGGNSAQQWASMARGNILDPSSMFITPQQQQQANTLNEILRQQSLQNKFNQQAAPEPWAIGADMATNNILSSINPGTLYSGIMGGSGGGGGGAMSLLGAFI